MIIGYVNITGKYADATEQKQAIRVYAEQYGVTVERYFIAENAADGLPKGIIAGDTLEVADISALGERFEDIIRAILRLAALKLRIYSVKECLMLDTGFPYLLQDSLEMALKVYKALLSLKNKAIQTNLLLSGKKRGRPFANPEAKDTLLGQEPKIAKLILEGVSKAEIARRLGVGRTTLYAFLNHRGGEKNRA